MGACWDLSTLCPDGFFQTEKGVENGLSAIKIEPVGLGKQRLLVVPHIQPLIKTGGGKESLHHRRFIRSASGLSGAKTD
jgi:hypothetical protein